jgi:hypothetical protein
MLQLKKLLPILALCFSIFIPGKLYAAQIYMSDFNDDLYSVDSVSGTATLIGNMGRNMFDLAIDSSGNLYGVDSSSNSVLYSINKANASVSMIGSLGSFVNALVFDAADNLYAAFNSLVSVDVLTGVGTVLGGIGFSSAGDIAFDNNGDLFMATDNGLVSVDVGTGSGSYIGNYGPIVGLMYGLSYDFATDKLIGAATSGNFYNVDRLTGAATFLVANGVQSQGSAQVLVSTPSILALLSLGVICLIFRRKYIKPIKNPLF